MSGSGSRWPLAVLPLVGLVLVLRERAAFVEAWPVWRPMLLDLLPVVAVAIAIAALIAGAVAWRGARS